jgi:hypothetical protein
MAVANWLGPYEVLTGTLDDGDSHIPEGMGVYLWVLPYLGQRLVQYVGYSENVRQRQGLPWSPWQLHLSSNGIS